MSQTPDVTVLRLQQAMNDHDLDALLECFHDDYESEQPAHPGRAFRGRGQVRRNWDEVFADVADFRCEIARLVAHRDEAWVEWSWLGGRGDGSRFDLCGVSIFRVADGRIAAGRLYMEPVADAEEDADAAIAGARSERR